MTRTAFLQLLEVGHLAHLDRLRPRAVPAGAADSRRAQAHPLTGAKAPPTSPVRSCASSSSSRLFTVAHSITLSCAALGWIVLPSRLVESAIAASVLIAALVNLLPRTAGASGVWIAFGFGLLHGFGFANVLSEVGADGEPVLRTLLGFNLGVELGSSRSSRCSCLSLTCCVGLAFTEPACCMAAHPRPPHAPCSGCGNARCDRSIEV